MSSSNAAETDPHRPRHNQRAREFRSFAVHKLIFPLAALVLAACGPKKFGDLTRPYFAASFPFSFCSSNIAIDGNRRVWSEQGCEADSSGYMQGATVSASRIDWLTTNFNGLPLPPPKTCTGGGPPDGGAEVREVVLFRGTADRTDEWVVCTRNGAADPPYDSLVAFFQTLPTAPGKEIP